MRVSLVRHSGGASRALLGALVALACVGCELSPGYSFFAAGITQPVGPTRGYVRAASWHTFSIDGRRLIAEHWSAGYVAGWNYMHESSHETITFDHGAASGLHARTLSVMPVLGGAQYGRHMRDDSTRTLQPYVGLLAGFYYFERRTSLGLFDVSDRHWRPGIAPQIGAMKRLSSMGRLMADLRYNVAIGSPPACSFVNLTLGFAWTVD